MHIPRLHPDTIDEVKHRADIYDVVSEHVVLRKRGKDYVGLCPFHSEKSPSFTVSQTKQMYYCFGCQAGGNAIKFLMDLEKRSFAEVVLDLARRYQVPVKTQEPEQWQELQRQVSLREQLYEVLAVAAQFYQHALKRSGENAMHYLQSKRQLRAETIQHFGFGYAPAGWETLHRYLVNDKNYPVPLVEKAGLIKPRKEGNGYYDVFRDRIMIPICDVLGRVIGFGGRTLGDDQPKYLNSPETEVFLKGKTLFALDKAKAAISQLDRVVVVEGYFDAIALHAAGITNAVASLGTALSLEQVRACLRYTESKQLILNFDADAAGTNATEKAIGEIAALAYSGEVQLRILNIPDGKDADEYLLKSSPEDYKQLLANAPLWLDWQIQQMTKDRDLKKATDFQQVSQQMVKLLQKIENNELRKYYVTYCANILSLEEARLVRSREETLETLLGNVSSVIGQKKPITASQKKYISSQALTLTTEGGLLEQAEALLLQIYLHYKECRQAIVVALEEKDLLFSLSHHQFLWQQILEIPSYQEHELLSYVQDRCLEFPEETKLISHLFYLNEKTQKEILLRHEKLIQAAIASMEYVMKDKLCRHLWERWQQTNPEVEPEKWQSYYQAFYVEKMRLQELERQRLFSLKDLV